LHCGFLHAAVKRVYSNKNLGEKVMRSCVRQQPVERVGVLSDKSVVGVLGLVQEL